MAGALHGLLRDGLEVFFYPRSQEELAGTNGLETMRAPFYDESRVVVVLYREPWGKTPWTGVEQTAITDRCLKKGWPGLFFMTLDSSSQPPLWLPQTKVRFNFAAFGIDQAVGAIKARVLENHGKLTMTTALQRAESLRAETRFRFDRNMMLSSIEGNLAETSKLFTCVTNRIPDIQEVLGFQIWNETERRCLHITNKQVSLQVTADSENFDTSLEVKEFDRRLPLKGEGSLMFANGGPQLVKSTSFKLDIDLARNYAWKQANHMSKVLSTEYLADWILTQFVDLVGKSSRGELKRKLKVPHISSGSPWS